MTPPCRTAQPTALPSWYRALIVLIGLVTLAGNSGVSGAFAVFYSTLLREFGWSHASAASVYSVNMVVLAAGAPLVGWALDRHGPRRVFPVAAAVIGVALVACGTLQSLAQYILFYGVISALGQTALMPVVVVVARWFAASQRGRVIGVVDVGTGLGMVVVVPGTAWLMHVVGWRLAFVILGVGIATIVGPLNLLHRPGLTGGTSLPQATSWRGVLRHRSFWMLCAAHLCMSITMTMVNVHLVEFLVSARIVDLLGASTLLSAVSLVSLGGRMFFGWLVDRLHGTAAFTIAMSCTMTGFVLLLLRSQGQFAWALAAFVVIYGFAQGAGGIAIAARTVELFQGPYLSTTFMVVHLSANLGAAFGAWAGGRLFDLSGSYALTFLTAIGSGVLAISWMWAGHTRRLEQPVPQ